METIPSPLSKEAVENFAYIAKLASGNFFNKIFTKALTP
jgi:hypothetical protein